MSETEIIEGFLCPICMKDLGTVLYLQSHFEEEHTAEDKVVFRQIKGLFDKAKRRILGEKSAINYADQPSASEGSRDITTGHEGAVFHHSFWEPQELGATRSSIDYFKSIRNARVDDFVVKTNRLLIRLDKLIIADLPTDPVKRKAYEKSIVDWTPDSHVPLCPTCTKSFSITRRRHHCRLCGGIMCHKCSQFLDYSYAKKLTNPAFNFEGESGFRERSGSVSSLNSLFNSEGDSHIRLCMDCRKQLEKRDQITEQRQNKSILVQLYDKMISYIKAANDMLTKYLPMVESLSQGDTRFDLQEAHLARRRLIKVYDSVDVLSKRILTLGLKDEDPPSAKQVSLQRSIHIYASNFLKDNMLGLEELPSDREYEKLQTVHKEQISKKIAAERLAVRESEHKRQLSSGGLGKPTGKPGHQRSHSADIMGVGWQPTEGVTIGAKADDPMIQQMNIIRGYIKQARQARKLDEVTMLEQNLHELQQEYLKQSAR